MVDTILFGPFENNNGARLNVQEYIPLIKTASAPVFFISLLMVDTDLVFWDAYHTSVLSLYFVH